MADMNEFNLLTIVSSPLCLIIQGKAPLIIILLKIEMNFQNINYPSSPDDNRDDLIVENKVAYLNSYYRAHYLQVL